MLCRCSALSLQGTLCKCFAGNAQVQSALLVYITNRARYACVPCPSPHAYRSRAAATAHASVSVSGCWLQIEPARPGMYRPGLAIEGVLRAAERDPDRPQLSVWDIVAIGSASAHGGDAATRSILRPAVTAAAATAVRPPARAGRSAASAAAANRQRHLLHM